MEDNLTEGVSIQDENITETQINHVMHDLDAKGFTEKVEPWRLHHRDTGNRVYFGHDGKQQRYCRGATVSKIIPT